MITPIELAMQKVLAAMAKTGLNAVVDSFQNNNVLDPRVISLHKEIRENECEDNVKKILKEKREAQTLQDFIHKGFELAEGEFTKRMATLNSPSFAPRALSVGDTVKKKRKKYRKKANKG